MIWKFLFTLAAVALVILGYKYVTRANLVRQKELALERLARKGKSRSPSAAFEPQDMVRCQACGVFVARGAGKCARPDCPLT